MNNPIMDAIDWDALRSWRAAEKARRQVELKVDDQFGLPEDPPRMFPESFREPSTI